MLGRTDEAIAVLRSAIAIDPTRPFAPSELGRYLLIEGKYEETAIWIDQLRKNGHTESALYVEIPLLFLQFKLDGAAAKLQQLIDSKQPSTRSVGYSLLARLLGEQGAYAEAIEILNHGIADDQAQGSKGSQANKLLDRAYLECKLTMFDPCIRDLRAARTFSSSPQTFMAASAILGSSLTQAPLEKATILRDELRALNMGTTKSGFGIISELMRTRLHGELLLSEGKVNDALEQFKRADKLDAPAGVREYLGRALLRAASKNANPEKAKTLKREALQAFGTAALRPGMVWHDAVEYPPGFLADEMTAYLQTASVLKISDESTRSCAESLKRLRGRASNLVAF
jgi:tetratricopeptide (TPR) repeat protein